MVSDEEWTGGGGETFEGLKSGFVPFPPKGFGIVAHLTTDYIRGTRSERRFALSFEKKPEREKEEKTHLSNLVRPCIE